MGALAVPVPVRGSQASQMLEKRMAGIYPTGAQHLDYRIAHISYIESIDPSGAFPNGTHILARTDAIALRNLGFAMARLGRGKSELQLLPAQPSTMHTRAPSPERKRDEGHSLMDTTALSVNAVLSPCSI